MKTKRRFDFVEKAIYTNPIAIELDFVSPHMRGSTLKRVDNERLVINQLSVGWIELLFAIFAFWLFVDGIVSINNRVQKQLDEYRKVATTEIFNKKVDNPNTISPYRTKVERKSKIEESEIIAKYKNLGEEGYREYLKEKEWARGSEKSYAILIVGTGMVLLVMGFPRRKRFIFDRKAGTVTYPRFMGIGSYKLSFQEVNFIYARAGMYVTERKGLAILRPNGVGRVFINFQYPERFLSFYVWYMDKNRPLPPGTAFDPYRELDYESRKAAGFPPPLYPSLIETPE